MTNLHHKLQLQHHRHTGKLLHHRHTSYHGLAIILGLAGVVIVGLNVLTRVMADELYVYARIPASVPTTAAVITSPANGDVLKTSQITVSGTCPVITPRVIISIIDNGQPVGSVGCAADDTFSVPITLSLGANTLVARSTTITGDDGPDSQAVTVTYVVAVTPPTGGSGNTKPVTPPPPGAPLHIATDQSFVVYGPAKDAILQGTISGGTAPYHVHIDWGDGTHSDYTTNETIQTFRHHYRHTGTYDITVTITDSAGAVLVQHFAAVTPYVPPVAAAGSTTPDSPLKQFLKILEQWIGGTKLIGVYGGYILVLALFGIFWLRRHPFAYAKVPARHSPTGNSRRQFTTRHTTQLPIPVAKKRRRKDTDAQ